ncbi:unnamed protein product, partial [Didymodactylos carnosus]
IKDFAKIAAPLFQFTRKHISFAKNWTSTTKQAYDKLKQALTTPPLLLNFPDDNSQLVLSTDASGAGMGGVLRQHTPNGIKVIKYLSKKFNNAQKKYSTTEKECMAMVWCIQQLKEYVWCRPFIVETDHCPLCSFGKKKSNNSRIDRWQVALSEYQIMAIKYKRGKCNCDADLLSRYPEQSPDPDDEQQLLSRQYQNEENPNQELSSPVIINAITRSSTKQLQSHASPNTSMTRSKTQKATNPIKTTNTANDISIIQTNTPLPTTSPSLNIDFSLGRIKNEQQKDKIIQARMQQINNDPHKYSSDIVQDGILYKLIERGVSTKFKLPWIPTKIQSEILFAYHDHPFSSHFGVRRTYHKIRNKYYWINMFESIQNYLRSCQKCTQFNTQRRKQPGLLQNQQPPQGVFEIMQMDFWKSPFKSSEGNQYVLVVTDRLSKYVFAKALPSATAKDAAQMIYEDIVLKHGAIKQLQSDQGPHFKNELMEAITKLTGCKQIFSIPYHPMSNGQVERFNSTFCDQLKKYNNININDWDEYLQSIVFAYNSGIHATTGFTPYEVAFTRKLLSPFDPPSAIITMSKSNDYWDKANAIKKIVIRAVRFNIQQQQQLSKQRYDRGRQHPQYKIDDLVWVKILTERSKLDGRHHGPFRIVQKLSDVKFIVQHEEEHYQQEKHINHLIPYYERY